MSTRAILSSRLVSAVVCGGLLILPVAVMIGAREDASEGALDLLASAHLQELLGNSLLLGIATVFVAALLGLPLALVMNLRDFPGRRLIGWTYFLPLLIPPHIHCISWTRVIGDRGWLTRLAKDSMGFEINVRGPIFDYIYWGPALIMGCAFFPLITLAVSSGVRALDGDGVEAARLMGGRRATLLRVILPQLGPRIAGGALFVFVLALSTYPVVSLLDTPVLVSKVFATFAQVDQSAGALMALPLVLVVCLLVVGFHILESLAGGARVGQRPVSRKPAGLLFSFWALVPFLIASGVPVVSLLIEAGPIRFDGSGDNYQSVFARVAPAFGDSLMMTGMGVVALLLVSYPMGRALARKNTSVGALLSLSGLALPPAVIGAALVMFWSKSSAGEIPVIGWLGTFVGLSVWLVVGASGIREAAIRFATATVFAGLVALLMGPLGVARWIYEERIALVVFAYVARFFPFLVRLFRNAFLTLDGAEDEAARLLGHGSASRWINVEFPRMRGVLVAGAILAYVLCITELAATILVIPPGWQSVQRRIFNMIHFRAVGEVSALCVMSIALAALPVVLALLMSRRKAEVI